MKQFHRVGAAKIPRSVFNLSYQKLLTCDMGKLIPFMADEIVPGDIWQIGNEIVVRMQPLVAPVLHEINVYTHYFFVPYRLLWDDWESFITGGADGTEAPTLPRWEPTLNTEGSLWDHLGFPVGIDPDGAYPIDFPKRAYNFIYNEYYRDETLIDEIDIETSEAIKFRAWEKDYFTSSLPFQQRGTAPALPIAGTTSAVWDTSQFYQASAPASVGVSSSTSDYKLYTNDPDGRNNLEGFFASNTVDLSVASTFDISDLRTAFQVQRWMERNARAGARYTEFLKAHFGTSPRDDRLDRPEYIGGSKSPVIVSEVLQTSSTDATTPQANMAGHGVSVDKRFVAKYRASEFGVIIGIMSIMPRAIYSQGINRQWLRETKYDFYFPEFANLSEQGITRAELYASAVDTENLTLFGYQGKYDEMRVKQNMFAAGMRTDFDYWHLGRIFSSAPELNQTFIECVPRKDIFAAPSEDGFIVSIGNIIRALRPLPIMSNPGLIDH